MKKSEENGFGREFKKICHAAPSTIGIARSLKEATKTDIDQTPNPIKHILEAHKEL